MTRRLIIAMLALCVGTHLTGCTSGSSKGEKDTTEANDQNFAEEGEGDFADDSSGAKDQAAKPKDETAPPEDSASDLNAPADKTAKTAEALPEDDLAIDEGTKEATPAPAPETPATTPPGEKTAETAPPAPTDEPVFKEETPAPVPTEPADQKTESVAKNETPVEPSGPITTPVYAPYQKVKDAPFTKAGVTLNRVYLARPKDTTKSIAKKIYGQDRAKDLVKWNPILKRGVKAGDKIYYASPSNPTDSHMMNYYEDIGAPVQTYVSKDGDNLHAVAKNLLGFKEAWKEVWATNPSLESKGNIAGGLEIHYWSDVPAAQPTAPVAPLAKNDMAPPSEPLPNNPPNDLPPPPPAGGKVAGNDPLAPPPMPNDANQPPSGEKVAGNDPLAPPPGAPPANASPAAVAAGTTGEDPLAPPPPPAPAAKAPAKPLKKVAPGEDSGTDPDTMMAIGFGGILLIAAAVLFVIIRRNRTKRMDLGQTQV